MSYASHNGNAMPPARHATLRRMDAKELIATLLREPDFGSVADIARASGWNYQRLHRWSKGSVADIGQDDLADLLVTLDREPQVYNVVPSLSWRRRRDNQRVLADDLIPQLDRILERVQDVPEMALQLDAVSDHLMRVESMLERLLASSPKVVARDKELASRGVEVAQGEGESAT